jgi:hypothetical protein
MPKSGRKQPTKKKKNTEEEAANEQWVVGSPGVGLFFFEGVFLSLILHSSKSIAKKKKKLGVPVEEKQGQKTPRLELRTRLGE